MEKLIEPTQEQDVLLNNGFIFLFVVLSSDGKHRFWRCQNKNKSKACVPYHM